jgi:hypothetical protein
VEKIYLKITKRLSSLEWTFVGIVRRATTLETTDAHYMGGVGIDEMWSSGGATVWKKRGIMHRHPATMLHLHHRHLLLWHHKATASAPRRSTISALLIWISS